MNKACPRTSGAEYCVSEIGTRMIRGVPSTTSRSPSRMITPVSPELNWYRPASVSRTCGATAATEGFTRCSVDCVDATCQSPQRNGGRQSRWEEPVEGRAIVAVYGFVPLATELHDHFRSFGILRGDSELRLTERRSARYERGYDRDDGVPRLTSISEGATRLGGCDSPANWPGLLPKSETPFQQHGIVPAMPGETTRIGARPSSATLGWSARTARSRPRAQNRWVYPCHPAAPSRTPPPPERALLGAVRCARSPTAS